MPKIFVYRATQGFCDCPGIAYAEDGEAIAVHVSSSHSWFRQDMGLNQGKHYAGNCRMVEGDWSGKHEKYKEKYPDGYELVEVIGREAMQRHIDAGEISGVEFDVG